MVLEDPGLVQGTASAHKARTKEERGDPNVPFHCNEVGLRSVTDRHCWELECVRSGRWLPQGSNSCLSSPCHAISESHIEMPSRMCLPPSCVRSEKSGSGIWGARGAECLHAKGGGH